MFEKGFFGDTFDFDGDGQLDAFERAADFGAFISMIEDDDDIDIDDDY